jgi:hypothetical protein
MITFAVNESQGELFEKIKKKTKTNKWHIVGNVKILQILRNKVRKHLNFFLHQSEICTTTENSRSLQQQ